MSNAKLPVYITLPADKALKKHLAYYRKFSEAYSTRVQQKLIEVLDSVAINPGRFPPDLLDTDRHPPLRFFIIENLRVTYQPYDDKIIVHAARHVKQNPKRS